MSKLDLIRRKAKKLGVRGDIRISSRDDKKFMLVRNDGKKVHFGAVGYEDYLDHGNKKRRKLYRTRHSNIYLKNGVRAIDVLDSPAWLSYNLLW